MSSRGDYRRRGDHDRERERDHHHRDREGRSGDYTRRRSRSRSPPRRGERDRRSDYPPRYRDGRRDRPDDRRRDDKREYEKDARRKSPIRDLGRDRPREGERDRERERDKRYGDRADGKPERDRPEEKREATSQPQPAASSSRAEEGVKSMDVDTPASGSLEPGEEGEEMDATNDDDAAMMAAMGINGFGTTKGKTVEGNQEGSVDIKKIRTWRQYMNRRGGFNRPLDKIK